MSRYTDEEIERIQAAQFELNPRLADRGRDDGHVPYVCTEHHEDGGWNCRFHAPKPDLFSCTVCGSFEGATTTDCPGRKIHLTDEVYAGRLDYRVVDGVGRWVAGPSSDTPALWRLACERAGVTA